MTHDGQSCFSLAKSCLKKELSMQSPEGQPPISVRMITVMGQRLRVAIRPGDRSRPPLLLMNGIGANLELFQPFVDALDPAIEVICFDVPGTGGSPPPAFPYRLWMLAWLIDQMLDQLGYDQVNILGISWGGGLAQQFALQHRRRCRRLVLVSTTTGVLMVPGHPAVLAKLATPQRYLDPDYLAEIAPDLYGGDLRSDPDSIRAYTRAAHSLSQRGYLFQLLATVGWTSLPWLPLIRQATLILAGDDDPIIPLANARIMQHLLPNARLHIFHGGHLGLLTQAHELAPIVARFLAEELPPGAEARSADDRSAPEHLRTFIAMIQQHVKQLLTRLQQRRIR
jgi:poly(3-hydroxyalkanoate) depolymerase